MRLSLLLWTTTLLSPASVRGQWSGFVSLLQDFHEAVSVMFSDIQDTLGKNLDQQRQTGPFPCNVSVGRSKAKPTSVNCLRPGDLQVVGALGDSLTVGLGLEARSVLDIIEAFPGRSWAIGGEGTWREFLTLPNILKEFNPSLVGYSTDEVPESWQLNVATSGAKSQDLMSQAKVLVSRILRHPRVDVLHDWKLISINIGHNDFCNDICKGNSSEVLSRHVRDMVEVLDFFQQHLPRTFVAITPPANLKVLRDHGPFTKYCSALRNYGCPCIFSSEHAARLEEMQQVMIKWQQLEHQVADMDRYNTADDFAVVVQPFVEHFTIPTKTYLLFFTFMDPGFFTADCFHFSQKTDARAANALWNNLLQPVGGKCTTWYEPFKTFYCPTEEHPYLYTRNNSRVHSVPNTSRCGSNNH